MLQGPLCHLPALHLPMLDRRPEVVASPDPGVGALLGGVGEAAVLSDKVLVLNRSWVAVNVATVRRASHRTGSSC